MSKQWSCNEHDCDFVATAPTIEEVVALVNQHMSEQHDSYELEEMIEDAAVDVSDE